VCAEQIGRAAAKVDGHNFVFVKNGRVDGDFIQERFEQSALLFLILWNCIKMTVRTFFLTKGEVKIEA